MTLSLDDARKNDELVSLADSQVLTWIDELRNVGDTDSKAKELKQKIRHLRSQEYSVKNRHEIRKLYDELDQLQFVPDYMELIIDRKSDYLRAVKGFSINGIRYLRLLGTTGGCKNSTIVFVSEFVHDELKKRITNGRDVTKPMVTAKLQAYQALTCSASTPVSMPNGILVVPDVETRFKDDIIYLSDEDSDEPEREFIKDYDVTLDATDGCGVMLPSLAERWSEELGLDYVMSGSNTRFSYEKGMLFTFDFLDFADKIANGNYMVKDAWGDWRDVREVEAIFTTSQIKLWDSYKNLEDYLANCEENKYTFRIPKVCPESLDNERTINYQYIQSYELSDDDIDDLIAPSMNEFKEVLKNDWRKSVLFMKGIGLNEKNVWRLDDDYAKALMIDSRVSGDPFVQSSILQYIKNRINEASVGVIKVHGNYSIASGDPYILCQSVFGLPTTGLLKAGEIYNEYWRDTSEVVCFRSPMSVHNNIRKLKPANNDEVNYWYRYIKTGTIFSAWSNEMSALNGMDFDGDLVFLTDNEVLLQKHKTLPALVCIQRKAEKTIPSESDFINSNIASMGSDIGTVTNRLTAMYDIQSMYKKDSQEYKTLSYRMECGQNAQQNSIDKTKGIICKPMPRYWHDRVAAYRSFDDEQDREFQLSIVADKKPYFMKNIYPKLKKEYNNYMKAAASHAAKEFGISIGELLAMDETAMADDQKSFVKYYRMKMPVSTGNSVMNKICRKFESEFSCWVSKHNKKDSFDYRIYKKGVPYKKTQFNAIKRLYENYMTRLKTNAAYFSAEKVDPHEIKAMNQELRDYFVEMCSKECNDRFELCDILLDLCYTKSSTKKMVWDICGAEIVENLLDNNMRQINVPVEDKNGEIEYVGKRFTVKTVDYDYDMED